MTYIPSIYGTVSTLNSTSTALTSNNTYTGTWEDISQYSSMQILTNTDVSGSLYAQFSTNGTDIDRNALLGTDPSGNIGIHGLVPVAKYFRVFFQNGSTSQTYLRLQTLYTTSGKISIPTTRITQSLNNYSDVLNTRSAIVGQPCNQQSWFPVNVNADNSLSVRISNPITAFGEVMSAIPTPIFQTSFIYGLNPYMVTGTYSGVGSTGYTSSSLLNLDITGTNTFAEVNALQYSNYKAGQGVLQRFSGIYNTGTTGSAQYIGAFTASVRNGFGFGYTGTTFCIIHANSGTTNWIPQNTWNVDLCDGSNTDNNPSGLNLIPTLGNIYQIQYQYLGFGDITFYIECASAGIFVPVHRILYPNQYVVPSLSNNGLTVVWRVENNTYSGSMKLRSGSGASFVEGTVDFLGPRFGYSRSTGGTTSQVCIFALKNATTYNGVTNRSQVYLRTINSAYAGSTATNAIGICFTNIYKNISGTHTGFTPISGSSSDNGNTIVGSSCISVSTAITSINTSGLPVRYNTVLANNTTSNENITELNINMVPGDILFFVVNVSDATGSPQLGVSVIWNENTN